MAQSLTAPAYSEPAHQEHLRRRLASRGNGFAPFTFEDGDSVLNIFARQVARRGAKRAVVCVDGSLTYRQLDDRADVVAGAVAAAGDRAGAPIAVLLNSNLHFFGAVFGILKAGAFYIPIDPSFPETRNAMILEDSGARLILTERRNQELAERLATAGQTVMYVDEVTAAPAGRALRRNASDDLASLIFTSGSTGRPKGVMHTHRTLLALVERWTATYCLGPEDRVTLLASVSVSAAFSTMFSVLLNGGTLFPLTTKERGLAALADWLDQQQITIYNSVPSLFRHLMQSIAPDRVFESVRVYRLGGDSLYRTDWELFKAHAAEDAVLVNSYGSTEISNVARYYLDAESECSHDVVPIGFPLSADVRIGVMDADGRMHAYDELEDRPRSQRIVGEIVFESRYLSPGYFNGAAIGSPDQAVRIYKTGDLGALESEHGLVHVGRGDTQVKISGFRVEIAEVESCLRKHPSVTQTAVVVATPGHGERELVGFVSLGEHSTETGADVRTFAAARIPGYMVPAEIVVVGAMPFTPNGKVDRAMLLKMRESAVRSAVEQPPATPAEVFLADIWCRLLKLRAVDVDENFFALGGNSLFALRVFNEIRPAAVGEMTLKTLYENPTIRELATHLDVKHAGEQTRVAIPAASRGDLVPMSFAQQRMWFLAQTGGVSEAYHIPLVFQLRGTLDRDALRRSLDRLVQRHDALRTTFAFENDAPMQRIASGEGARFTRIEHDLRGRAHVDDEVRELITREACDRFDLANGPVVRGRLIHEAESTYTLLITMHHIVSDGWSSGVLADELSASYEACLDARPDPLRPLAIRYADYSAWQHDWIESAEREEQANYWKAALTGAPPLLELPTDRPRPVQSDFAGSFAHVAFDEALTAGMKALASRNDSTVFTTLLTAWAIVLSRLSGQDDVVIGTPVANRGRAELEALIGLFVNTLPLRVRLPGSSTVGELIAQVRDCVVTAQQHQDIPFEQIVDVVRPIRSLSSNPLFQAAFAWNNTPQERLRLRGLEVDATYRTPPTVAKFDLTLSLRESGGAIFGGIEYATALFDAATIERFGTYLRSVIEGMIAGDARRIDEIELMAAAEREQVVRTWNDTARALPAPSLPSIFAAQVVRAPDAVAVQHGSRRLTYAELDQRANALAALLREHGAGTGKRVAVVLERSIELVIAELAVVKCGAAYVPLDPAYPAERLQFILDDTECTLIVAARAGFPEELIGPRTLIAVDEAGLAGIAPEIEIEGDSVAYVMYTSGSTGKPKGVMVPHQAIVRLVVNNGYAEFTSSDRFAFAVHPAFDVATFEVWGPLLNGGTIVVVDQETLLSPSAFARLLEDQGVTVLWLTVGLFNHYADVLAEQFAKLRYLITGGDALDPAVIARVLRQGRPQHLLNGYGPTEATTFATTHEITAVADDARSVPIGRPIGNTRIYILDESRNPVPVGVTGELYIGGVGVALGYLNRPELNGERFISSPFVAGDRLYKTGDLARWFADGTIDFIGRNDGQVKLRGFRVELGEIESSLMTYPTVEQAIVIVRGGDGDKQLVAYYTSRQEVAVDDLRVHLAGHLPGYMVPAAFVPLDRIPLTPNGKIDRAALPVPDASSYVSTAYEAPQGEVEIALAQIWADLLKIERVGRHDDFFELGGHSLLAIRAANAIRRIRNVDVSVSELFARPVLKDLAGSLQTAASAAVVPVIGRAARTEYTPLSFAQQRLWFMSRIDGARAAYNSPFAFQLRGPLNCGALSRALDRIAYRHEILRTAFVTADGVPLQRALTNEHAHVPLVEDDLRDRVDREAELARLTAMEARAPFDLENGSVVRGRLIREDDTTYTLLITMHHIVGDMWSIIVLLEELGTLYAAFLNDQPDPLPPLPVQYADYAVWQRELMSGELLERQAAFWKKTLTGVPALLELPSDRSRAPKQDHRGSFARLAFDEELTDRLKALAARNDTTLYTTLLTAWSILLLRLSGQNDIVIGTPVANRGHAEIEPLIGFFVNSLVLRFDLGGAPSVKQVLAHVKERTWAALEHQEIPFEQIVDIVRPVRSLAYSPLFQNMFAWNNRPQWTLTLPDIEVGPGYRSAPTAVKFDITLSLQEHGERLVGGFEYAAALFDHTTVERFGGYLRNVLEEMIADELRPITELAIVPDAERERTLVTWNDTARAIPNASLPTLFDAQARRVPDAVAVRHHGLSLTYAELNARANRLAAHLQTQGAVVGSRVALVLERSIELIVAQLAVVKCGAAYAPLAPDDAADRLQYLIEDCGAALVISNGQFDRALAGGRPVVDAGVALLAGADVPAAVAIEGDAVAYVMYTSGSTGEPKGVMVPHQAVVRVVVNNGYAEFTASDRFTFASNPAFDAATFEVWGPLLNGGTIVVVDQETLLAPSAFGRLLEDEGVTVLWLTVGLFNQYADVLAPQFANLRYLMTGGDALDPRVVARVLRQGRPQHLLNGYGPTETTTFAATYEITATADDARSIPIGRPIGNTRIYVLDAARNPVPVGVTGELYIGGLGVALGYLNSPELNGERFIPSPFVAGDRLYKTGDLGRWLADGTIDFVGRNDGQVKLRGFRVELGEIESSLVTHPSVEQATVVVRTDAGDKQLVAYYTSRNRPLTADGLRAHLADRLPGYMMPAAFVPLESIPLTPNGKLDRAALPAPDASSYLSTAYEAPHGEIEAAFAQIWADLLKVERIGRHDNFFDLGGHSLLALRAMNAIRRTRNIEVSVSEMFARPVLKDLAGSLQDAARAAAPLSARVERIERVPLSSVQQLWWRLAQTEAESERHHVAFGIHFAGDLNVVALRAALERIVTRHEALRTAFAAIDGEPVQRIIPAAQARFTMRKHDLRNHPEAEAERLRIMDQEASAPFDVEQGPFARGCLVREGPGSNTLLITLHRIVADEELIAVFADELRSFYEEMLVDDHQRVDHRILVRSLEDPDVRDPVSEMTLAHGAFPDEGHGLWD
jgi:amino acid adenylation domain-containing protein